MKKINVITFIKGLICKKAPRENKEALAVQPVSMTNRKKVPTPPVPIIQRTQRGIFVAKYPSIAEAARRTGAQRASIIRCCKGRQKSAGGSRWEYGE